MSIRYLTVALVALAFATVAGTASADGPKPPYEVQKVVYHINDLEQANGGYRNIGNHLNAVGDDAVEIIVVTHSSGVFSLLDGAEDSKGNTFDHAIMELHERGVQFQICANTLQGNDIAESDYAMVGDIVEIVPSGVAHVAHLQQQGYTYLKP